MATNSEKTCSELVPEDLSEDKRGDFAYLTDLFCDMWANITHKVTTKVEGMSTEEAKDYVHDWVSQINFNLFLFYVLHSFF